MGRSSLASSLASIPERNDHNSLNCQALLTSFFKFTMLFIKKTGSYNKEAISSVQNSLNIHK